MTVNHTQCIFLFLDLLSVFQQNLKKTMVIRKIMQVP